MVIRIRQLTSKVETLEKSTREDRKGKEDKDKENETGAEQFAIHTAWTDPVSINPHHRLREELPQPISSSAIRQCGWCLHRSLGQTLFNLSASSVRSQR
jgi:hypothetical protein